MTTVQAPIAVGVGEILLELDPGVPLYDVRPLTQDLAAATATHRYALLLLAIFALTALVNMVYLLMSGLFTPFASMPEWAQVVGQLSPVKHFIEIMRAVLVRGAGFEAVAVPLSVLVVYGLVVFALSIRQFSKTTN